MANIGAKQSVQFGNGTYSINADLLSNCVVAKDEQNSIKCEQRALNCSHSCDIKYKHCYITIVLENVFLLLK